MDQPKETWQSLTPIMLSPLSSMSFNKCRPLDTISFTSATCVLASGSCTPEAFLPTWSSLYQLWVMALLGNDCPVLVPLKAGSPTVFWWLTHRLLALDRVPQPKGSKPSSSTTSPSHLLPIPPKKRGKSISINVECNIIKCQLLRSCALKIIFDSFWST